MEEDSVVLTITRVNMLGAPGTGKTCAERLLLNEDPPCDDNSTSFTYPTVRATCTRVAFEDKTKWVRVTKGDLLAELAANLLALVKQKEPVASIEIVPDSATSHMPHGQLLSDASIEKDQFQNYCSEELVKELLSTPPKKIRLSDHWLYVIDSGGQPAYQELLPLFTRAASLNIITLDLSKSFEEKFKLEYRIAGKYFPCHSKSTQLAIFRTAVSTGVTFKPLNIPHVTRKPMHSMHLILGTHYDKVKDFELGECEKTLKSSMSSLQPYLRDYVIRKSADSIIFPINTIAESEERVKYSRKICQAIWFHGSDASLTIKIPIRWFAFELTLANKSIIPIEEALSIGKRFGMNEENTKQALQYFHDVGLNLYYPEVTDAVIIDFQPILDILSHLLALTYVDDVTCWGLILHKSLPLRITNNLKEGLFNEDIFSHLKMGNEIFLKPHFELPDLIKLLLHLHIITEVVNNDMGRYFIPYALPSYDDLVTPKMKNIDAKPLLIVWKGQHILPVPQGLIPLTIIHLLNQKKYVAKIPPSTPDYYKYRDAMSLKITFVQQHTLHIINRYTHIEVYFTGPPKHCPQVRQLVIEAIDHSTEKMHMEHNHITAFSCPRKDDNCYCVVDEVHKVVNCTMCAQSPDIIDDHYWCWFDLSGK